MASATHMQHTTLIQKPIPDLDSIFLSKAATDNIDDDEQMAINFVSFVAEKFWKKDTTL